MDLPTAGTCLLLYISGVIHTGRSQKPCAVQIRSTQEYFRFDEWAPLNCMFNCSKPSWETRLKKRNIKEGDNWVSIEVLVNGWEKSNISCISDDDKALKSTVTVTAYVLPRLVTIDLEELLDEGEVHEATCTVFDVAPLANLQISVMKEGQVIDLSSFSADNSKEKQSVSETYQFMVTRRDNLRDFYCQATLDLGEVKENMVQSKKIKVNTFAKPDVPSISITPATTVKEGESVTLTCHSEGFPEPEYSWDLPPNTHVTYSQDKSRVIITKATFAHRGSYLCVAKNPHGRVRGEEFLDVIENPGAKPEVPSILITPATTVEEGESVSLTCHSEGFPEPEYSWDLPNNAHVTYSQDNCTVIIVKATSDHSGNYMCVAKNKHGRVQGEAFLDVMKKPGALPDIPFIMVFPNPKVNEGDPFNLSCHSDGFPEPEYFWTIPSKAHVTFSADQREIFITKATSAHNGTYECQAQNTHGNVGSQLVIRIIGQSNGVFHTRPTDILIASALVTMLVLL